MSNDEKILQVLSQIQGDIAELKQGQAKLEQGQTKLEQGQTKLELIIENEIKRDIKIIAENHLSLNQKLEDLKDLNERVLDLQKDTDVLKVIAKESNLKVIG